MSKIAAFSILLLLFGCSSHPKPSPVDNPLCAPAQRDAHEKAVASAAKAYEAAEIRYNSSQTRQDKLTLASAATDEAVAKINLQVWYEKCPGPDRNGP